MLTETDSLGKTTRYFYDDDSGYLLAEIKPDGTGLSYTYDDLGNVQTVLPAEYVNGNAVSVGNSANVSYEYDETNRLEKIITDSTEYTFEYNSFGSTTKIFAGSNTLASYTYNSNNGKLSAIDYGNGYGEEYVYDDLDRLKEIYYVVGSTPFIGYRYSYDSNGNLISVEDVRENVVTYMEYDARGRLTGTSTAENGDLVSGSRIGYDEESRIQSYRFSMSIPLTNPGYRVGVSIETSYFYNSDGSISNSSVSHLNYENRITPTYDAFGRTTTRETEVWLDNTYKFSLQTDYTYKSNGKAQSYLVSEESTGYVLPSSDNVYETHVYKYIYDDNGNITEIYDENDLLYIKYWYDELGQLVREDNRYTWLTTVWTYDDAGNITKKDIYALYYFDPITTELLDTINYTYQTGTDRLISYDGESITYDAIGNPTSYRGKALTWQNGRELASYDGKYTYSYNADGIRTSKTYNNNGVTYETEYIVDGTKVMRQSWTSEDGTDYVVDYMYDELGRPVSFAISEDGGGYQYYIYETNMFGDVVMIYASNSAEIVSFTYSAYGEITTNVIISQLCDEDFLKAALFRYRGYIYDTESGLYYLQSRYYDPEVGRFINTDGYVSTGTGIMGYNMYAYCHNNPVIFIDPTGEIHWGGFIAGLGIVAGTVITVATLGIGGVAGGMVAAAAISTGIMMTQAAATETTMVIDVSASVGSVLYGKAGGSLVLDFSDDGGIYAYTHTGYGLGYNTGISYSVGVVDNFEKPDDFSGEFADVFGGYNLGIDHGVNPNDLYNISTKSTSITFSSGFSAGAGRDYYSQPLTIIEWE